MTRILAAIALAGLLACAQAGDGPSAPVGGDDPNTATVSDPIGDVFGFAGPLWDLTALTITRNADGITVALDLSANVISPVSGGDSSLIAFIDLDLDQNGATGFRPVADDHRPDGGSSGTGSEARVNLSVFGVDSTVDVTTPHGLAGKVKPVFQGRRVTIRIPKAVLGDDDGFLNATALVGNSNTPTDFIPEQGFLTTGGTSVMSPSTALGSRPLLHDSVWRSR